MNFAKLFLVLRARWKVVLLVALGVIVTAVVISLLLPKQYTAATSVVVDTKGVDPISGMPMQMPLLPSYMATQVDIINSDRVAQRVVKALKLDQIPKFREQWQEEVEGKGSFEAWLGGVIAKKLDVKPSRESNVLNISFTWPDAKASATFANAFTQAYIDTSLDASVEPAKNYANFFEARTKIVRADLEAAQKRLSDFQRENGITAQDERMDVESARLNELSSQLVAAQSQRMDSLSRQQQTTNKDTLPEVLQNQLLGSLKADLARAEARREDVVTRLGKNHPEYQRTESEVASLRDRVAQETARIVNSVGTTSRVTVQHESDIRAALDAQKKKLLALKNQRDQLTVLQNDVFVAQKSLETISGRLTQSTLQSQSQQTNIYVLNAASEPIKPNRKLVLNIAIAIVLGCLLGLGTALLLELLDERVRGSEDLAEVLGAPVLGVLPLIDDKGRRGRFRKPGKLKLEAA